eukprot:gene9378-biopygen1877
MFACQNPHSFLQTDCSLALRYQLYVRCGHPCVSTDSEYHTHCCPAVRSGVAMPRGGTIHKAQFRVWWIPGRNARSSTTTFIGYIFP